MRCRGEFTAAQLVGVKACPACGTTTTPADCVDDVTVAINWHELRILCIWAEHWARMNDRDEKRLHKDDMLPLVYAIAKMLQEQHPSKRTPLTLSAEVAQLLESFDVETNLDLAGPLPPKVH